VSEENPTNLSPEKLAEIHSVAANIVQYVRQALATGISLEFLKTALVKNMGLSKDMVETMIEKIRDRLRREATVDLDFEVDSTLTRLELVFNLAMRENDYKTALDVIRERARFTGAAAGVRVSSRQPKRVPSAFDKALDEIGGPERELLRQEMEKKVLARANEMREKDAAEKERVKAP